MTHATIDISLTLPVNILIITQEIRPIPIPKDIEYPNAITATVKNAGNAAAGLLHSIFLTDDIINTPTQINAADVALDGIICAIGLKNIATKKHKPLTNAAKPVLPPAATPEDAST